MIDEKDLDIMLDAMVEASGYSREQLLGRSRGGVTLCPCRYFIWYHLWYDKKWSQQQIANPFGRSHCTVLHGIRMADVIIETPCYKVEQKIYDIFLNILVEVL